MTAKLIVTNGPDAGRAFALSDRIIFNLGSDPNATIPLADPQVAPNHCRLYREDHRFTLFDVSGLGLHVNGKRTVKAELRPGDRIRIGATELVFQSDVPLEAPAPQPHLPPPSTSPAPGGLTSGDFRIDVQRPGETSRLARVWLQCVEGNDKGKTFDLSEGNVWVVGRGHSADVTVMDIKASRAHCRIDRVGDTFYINDLNSTNGTYVNGQQVERQVLARGDYIKIGYTIFTFQYETVEEAAAKQGGGSGVLPPPPPGVELGSGSRSGGIPPTPLGAGSLYPPAAGTPVGAHFDAMAPPQPSPGLAAPNPAAAPPPFAPVPPGPPVGGAPVGPFAPQPGVPGDLEKPPAIPSPFGESHPPSPPGEQAATAPFAPSGPSGTPHATPPQSSEPSKVSVAGRLELDLSALDEDSDTHRPQRPAPSRGRMDTATLAAPALDDLEQLDPVPAAVPPPAAHAPPEHRKSKAVCFLCQQPIPEQDLQAGRYRRIHDNDYCLGCVGDL